MPNIYSKVKKEVIRIIHEHLHYSLIAIDMWSLATRMLICPTLFTLSYKKRTIKSLWFLNAYHLKKIILLIHCNDAEKLVLPNYQLAGSSLSRKHGLATFVHERLRYTLLDQSPPTSEIEWLCVDVDRYKIVNVYKPPPTQLRILDLPVFTQPCLYAGNFNCRHADWGYDDNSPDGE